METLAFIAGVVIVAFIGLLGLIILWKIGNGDIDLDKLLAEKGGGASFSRFQFLVFTFVVAMCVLVLTLESGEFPPISPEVLALLGISGGSYVVSKGIQKNAEVKKDEAEKSLQAKLAGVPVEAASARPATDKL